MMKEFPCSPKNTIFQDALHTPGVTSCPPLRAKGPGLPEIHLQAHPMEVSGLGQSQIVHHSEEEDCSSSHSGHNRMMCLYIVKEAER